MLSRLIALAMLSRFSDLVDGCCEGSLGDQQLAPLTTLHPLDPILKTLDHLPQKTPKNSNQFLFFSATSSKSPFPHHRLCTCGSVTCTSHRRYRRLSTHSARHPFKRAGALSRASKSECWSVSLRIEQIQTPTLCLPRGIANAFPSVEVSSKTWRTPPIYIRIYIQCHCVCECCLMLFERRQ